MPSKRGRKKKLAKDPSLTTEDGATAILSTSNTGEDGTTRVPSKRGRKKKHVEESEQDAQGLPSETTAVKCAAMKRKREKEIRKGEYKVRIE